MLEKVCLNKAGHRFSQANDTPLLQQPMIQWFREIGTNRPTFRQVLQGKFHHKIGNPYVVKLLKNLKKTEHVPEFAPWSLEDYTIGWKKAREVTSSSLSGIHFGHYMAGTFNPNIVLFNATMADLPLKTGYSLRRWRQGLNVMLEKLQGTSMWRNYESYYYSKWTSIPIASGSAKWQCTWQNRWTY